MPLTTRTGRNASQNEFELHSFIKLMQTRGVTRYLEIGARHGDTFFDVMRALPPGSYGVALDLPGGLWGTRASQSPLIDAVQELRNMGYRASYILGNSRDAQVLALVNGRGPYDAILIDGDHTLEGVTADWKAYGKMAPLVAFHDIVGDGCAEKVYGNPVQVPALWEDLRRYHETVEFVDVGSKMGIGCVLQ